jgi:hypothetical protein
MILRIWFRRGAPLVRATITERFPYRDSDKLLGIVQETDEYSVVLIRCCALLDAEQYQWLWPGKDAGLISYEVKGLEWEPKEWERRALEAQREAQQEDAA